MMSDAEHAAQDLPAWSLTEAEAAGIYIVIAAYNEGAKIAEVVTELRARLPHIVVVDDGSRDDTGQRAFEAGATVLPHAVNRGQGAALQTGITYALRCGASVVVTFDADGQHRMLDIPAMVRPILAQEVHVCLGSRFLEHGDAVPVARRWLLAGAVVFTRLMSGVRLSDAHNGFRAFSREAAQQLELTLDRMAHASEIIDQIRESKLPFREIPVHIRYTDYSRAKGQTSSAALRVAVDYLWGKLLK